MAQLGLSFATGVDKCCWLAIGVEAKDLEEPFRIHGQEITEVAEFELLGVRINAEGDSTGHVRNRIAMAWRAYFSQRSIFRCKKAPITGRYQLLTRTILQSLLWGVEACELTADDLARLDHAHVSMAVDMLATGREQGETWLDFAIRRTLEARASLEANRSPRAARMALSRFFRYAGHVARLDRSRLLAEAIRHRDEEWWHLEKQRPGSQRFRHRRAGFQVRWESRLERGWKQTAQDKGAWRALEEDWLNAALEARSKG